MVDLLQGIEVRQPTGVARTRLGLRPFFRHREGPIAGLEVALVLALLLYTIWLSDRGSGGVPWPYYAVFFGCTFLSHWLHGDTAAELGIRLDTFPRALAEAVAVFTPALILTIVIGSLLGGGRQVSPARLARSLVAVYPWTLFQQYGLQCFFGRRLAAVVRHSVGHDLLCAAIFAALHLPNPFLTVVTLGSAYCWCVLFRRCPNLFALAASHALASSVMYHFIPPSVTHLMRVGPGYFATAGFP